MLRVLLTAVLVLPLCPISLCSRLPFALHCRCCHCRRCCTSRPPPTVEQNARIRVALARLTDPLSHFSALAPDPLSARSPRFAQRPRPRFRPLFSRFSRLSPPPPPLPTMPPKNQQSKKAIDKAKKSTVEDRTFGTERTTITKANRTGRAAQPRDHSQAIEQRRS